MFNIVQRVVAVVAATPLPIDVRHVPPPDSFAVLTLLVSIVLAGVTGFLFLATRNMASETKRLADKTAEMALRTAELATDTVSATAQADRHHQQSLWPLLVAQGAELVDESGQPFLSVTCKNIGSGVCVAGAIRVTALNTIDATAYHMTANLAPCGTGEVMVGMRVALAGSGTRSVEDVKSIVFVIEFQSMFDSLGRTKWILKSMPSGDKMGLGALLPVEYPQIISAGTETTGT